MHWFWRAMIAIIFGLTSNGLVMYSVTRFGVWWGLFIFARRYTIPDFVEYAAFNWIPPACLTVFGYSVISRYWPLGSALDNETRCRKCQYILKGISEPICPECGERI